MFAHVYTGRVKGFTYAYGLFDPVSNGVELTYIFTNLFIIYI